MFGPFTVPTVDVLSPNGPTVLRSAVGGTHTATYQLNANGHQFYNTNSGTDATSDKGSWVAPNANASTYECFVTVTSGTLTTGTSGSWQDLASTQTWTKQNAGPGSFVVTFTLDIRRKGTSTVLSSTSVTLDVEDS